MNIRILITQQSKTENTQESLELAAYCWLGYPKRSQNREEYFAKRTQDREEAIANDPFKEQHPSMPISKDRQTRVTFGGTKKN
jgi:hypothetical protein